MTHGSVRPSIGWDLERLPTDMISEARWLNWRPELRDGKWSKVPYVGDSPRKASSTDPATWADFWTAAAATESGLGFALGDGWLGIDLDDVADPNAPHGMQPWVWEWLLTHDCYAEWSVSGTGIHVIARGASLPEWAVNRRGNVEVYQTGRYFTVSGRAVFEGRECTAPQAAVDALCRARLLREVPRAPEPLEAPTDDPDGSGDASAADWSVACSMAQRGLPASVIESALRTKMIEEGRSGKAMRADYIPNTVTKALQAASRPGGRRTVEVKPPRILPFAPFEKPEYPPEMREPLIDGLLRRGEIMNWIGAPKTGKSWLLARLMLGMVSGHGFTAKRQDLIITPGRVLLIDVELHPETLANRLHDCARQIKATAEQLRQGLDIMTLRGQWATLDDVEATIEAQPPRTWSMIALDAFYRFIPAGMRENENADMTQIYNQLDRIARKADSAIVVVHHTTKGTQTEKSTMDVGAGAGAIGRATDSHVTFLRHRKDGYLVMQAETRSWKRPDPRVVHLSPPDIAFDETMDPTDLWYPGCDSEEE
jgi:hypothetical protein